MSTKRALKFVCYAIGSLPICVLFSVVVLPVFFFLHVQDAVDDGFLDTNKRLRELWKD